jgi:hypothetical protein
MTDDQIILLAEENLYCNVFVMDWSRKTEYILKFARVMYEKGYEKGRRNPPSLKEQALTALHAVAIGVNDTREQHQDLDTIRRALEQLND